MIKKVLEDSTNQVLKGAKRGIAYNTMDSIEKILPNSIPAKKLIAAIIIKLLTTDKDAIFAANIRTRSFGKNITRNKQPYNNKGTP